MFDQSALIPGLVSIRVRKNIKHLPGEIMQGQSRKEVSIALSGFGLVERVSGKYFRQKRVFVA
jgi:hypothetical protein